MEGFRAFFGWVTGHEPLLSGLAAIVVIGGVMLSPLGHGLRLLSARTRPNGRACGNARDVGFPPMVNDRPSIVVLPFRNMSDDREHELLADGMTMDVITGLALSRSLFVIDRSSSFAYKDKPVNVRDVSLELGVRTVLEGSVRRVGEVLRVGAQLIDGRTRAHLWTETYDRPLADIFRIQDEITASIVGALASHLEYGPRGEVSRARPANLEAWELCQKARTDFDHIHDATSRRLAETLFRKAVKKDPDYAVAWVSLGIAIASRWYVEDSADLDAGRKEARACVEQAMRLAPTDPEVLAGHGRFLAIIGQPRDAVPFLEQARRLNPYEVAYRAQLARALVNCGRAAEALDETEAVLRLSPRDPFASFHYYQMAEIQLALGHHAESESWARRALASGFRPLLCWMVLANALGAQGRREEAHNAVREGVRAAPDATRASVERRYRGLGIEETRLAALLQHLAVCWPPELA